MTYVGSYSTSGREKEGKDGVFLLHHLLTLVVFQLAGVDSITTELIN